MAAQADYTYSRQAEDIAAVTKGIKAFEKDMKKVMVLMTDLGTSLESVSHSFDALTSLSFTNEEVKRYVHHFSEAVVEMKQGAPFQNYNRLVHEEVLQPVQDLKKCLKEVDGAQKMRTKAFKKREKARQKVDKAESSYAAKGKSLEECHKYPTLKVKREEASTSFDQSDEAFQATFHTLIEHVEQVTSKTMKRYLQLNAGYMSSVMDSLVKTDPTVSEAVDIYRRQLTQERQSEIARQRAQVAEEISRLSAAPSMDASPVPAERNDVNTSVHSTQQPKEAIVLSDSGVQAPLSQPATLTKKRQQLYDQMAATSGPPAAIDDGAKHAAQDVTATAHVDPQSAQAVRGTEGDAARESPLTHDNLQPLRPAPAPGPMFEKTHSDHDSDAPSTVVPSSGYFSAQKRELANEFRSAIDN